MADVYELFLTCPKGLESLLLEEAQGLGLDEARAQVSAVRGQGSLEVAYRLCLWSRLANRVLLVLARFPVENAESMYMAVHAVNWEDHLDAGGTLAVEFSGKGSGIDNTHFGALKVKDAIVDQLRETRGFWMSFHELCAAYPWHTKRVARVLPDDAANADCPPFFAEVVGCPHSVVTVHLVDEAGQPTIAARDEILAFFARRLRA